MAGVAKDKLCLLFNGVVDDGRLGTKLLPNEEGLHGEAGH